MSNHFYDEDWLNLNYEKNNFIKCYKIVRLGNMKERMRYNGGNMFGRIIRDICFGIYSR